MSNANKKLLIHGCISKEGRCTFENLVFEVVDHVNLKTEAVKANCMMDIPDYLKDYKPKGRSKADRKRAPRWPRR